MDLGSIILRKIHQRKKNAILSQLYVESKENRRKKKKNKLIDLDKRLWVARSGQWGKDKIGKWYQKVHNCSYI